jgi:hypothetical protein
VQCAVKGVFLSDGRAMHVRGLVSPFSHNAEGTKLLYTLLCYLILLSAPVEPFGMPH